MRYFYIEPAALQTEPVTLAGPEARHIKNVLRLKRGSGICLADGEGFEYRAIIQRVLTDRVELEITHKQQGKRESPKCISVAQAMLKEKKMDRLLRHLCELGISQWIPFKCERSIPTPGANRLASRRERWQKIVQESMKQCQRAKLPQIADTKTFKDVLKIGQNRDLTIVFYENEKISLDSLVTTGLQATAQNILLILGPEGGFAEGEIEMARATGCRVVGLGPRILRAETATIAACALVQYLFGDMG